MDGMGRGGPCTNAEEIWHRRVRPRRARKLRVKVVSSQRGCTARVVTPDEWGYSQIRIWSAMGKMCSPQVQGKHGRTRKGYLTKAAKSFSSSVIIGGSRSST